MSGGIIIQRAGVLIPTATNPVLHDSLPSHCKDRVDEIAAKGAAACTQEDVETLAAMIMVAVHS